MIFLTNPAPKGKAGHRKGRKPMARTKRRPPAGHTWKSYMASIRPKHGHKSKRRHASNPPKRHAGGKRHVGRRSHRNPPRRFTVAGFPNLLLNGAIDAGEVVIGKAIAKSIPPMFGFSTTDGMGLLVVALSAIGAGFVGSFISPNAGKMMLAGGLAAPVETLIKGMNVPVISAALGDDDLVQLPMSAYPREALEAGESYSAYPGSDQYGDAETYDAAVYA